MEESTTATESVADLSNKYVEIRNEREAKREVFEGEDKGYSDQLAEIESCRYDVVPKTDSSLQQLIDNIVEIYLRTLYKLKFLA